MRIIIAFIVAFGIGAASRWTGVPSLAPQAIVGALLIVAMSTGYVSADRLLKRISSPSVTVAASTGARAEMGAHEPGSHRSQCPLQTPEPEADIAFWRQNSEGLQLIIADLLRFESAAARLRKYSKLPGRRLSNLTFRPPELIEGCGLHLGMASPWQREREIGSRAKLGGLRGLATLRPSFSVIALNL